MRVFVGRAGVQRAGGVHVPVPALRQPPEPWIVLCLLAGGLGLWRGRCASEG